MGNSSSQFSAENAISLVRHLRGAFVVIHYTDYKIGCKIRKKTQNMLMKREKVKLLVCKISKNLGFKWQ